MSLKITQNFRTYCCFLLAFILSAFSYGNLNAQVFISEYAEGDGGNNKYIEIYNGGNEVVDLTEYAIARCSNACTDFLYESWNSFDEGATLAPGDVYTMYNSGCSDDIIATIGDNGQISTMYFNGNDAYLLVYGTEEGFEVVDGIGDFATSGTYWDVAGVYEGTINHTLVRKCSVTQGNPDWAASAGTSVDDSEWIVLDANDFSNLDLHTSPCDENAIFGCTDVAACNYNSSATDDDGTCIDPNVCGSCSDDLSCLVNVTVSVDMGLEGFDNTDGIDYDGLDGSTMAVRLDGGDWMAMSDDDSDGVWEYTFSVAANSSHVYNFNDGAGSGYESGSNLGDCATGNFGNDRTFTATDVDLVVPTACWESCAACISSVPGCTDVAACNYNADATEDDLSCTYAAEGFDCEGNCLAGTFTTVDVEEAVVYSFGTYTYTLVGYGGSWSFTDASTGESVGSTATDNFSGCLVDGCYEVSGISGSGGYSFAYTLNGGEMVIPGNANEIGSDLISIGESGCITGCTDESAENYDATAHITDNTLCEYALVQGCMDATACNYDETAEQDNGSCTYAAENADCDGNCLEGTALSMDMTSQNWADGTYGATYTVSLNGVVVASGPEDTGNWAESSDDLGCLVDGCYEVDVQANGFAYSIDYYTWIFNGSSFGMDQSGFVSVGENGCITACTDEAACNYTADADVSDISLCEYANTNADCDGNCLEGFTLVQGAGGGNSSGGGNGGGACVAIVEGCTDATACNYSADANTDDSSCSYSAANADCNGDCLEGFTSGGANEVTFTLDNGSDISLAENRDIIIPGEVEIARGSGGPLYNYAVCDNPWDSCGILWKFGSIDHPTSTWNVEFECEDNDLFAVDGEYSPSCNLWNLAGETFILHCLESDRYFEVLFNQWSNGGGQDTNEDTYTGEGPKGFSYTRIEIDSEGNAIDAECVAAVEGCTDTLALNYNADANVSNDLCTYPNYIDFTVDMNGVDYNAMDYDNVVINGSWNGWLGWGVTLTDADGDGVWTGTGEIDPAVVQFEYVVAITGPADGWSGWGQQFGNGCEGTNFIVIFEEGVDTYAQAPTVGCDVEPATNTVDFTVDMNSVEYDSTGIVVINGTWNGWNGWGVELSDADGDGVWTGSGTFDPAIGQFEYVVSVTSAADGWSGWGPQWGNGCEGTNFLVIFEEGVDTYAQAPTVGCAPVDPTVFTVDMNCAGVEFGTVHLTGPLWGWTTDIIMSDEDGDGIYSITMENLTGDIEYKYMVDYFASQENLVDDMVDGATCAPVTDYVGYANRVTPAGVTTSDTYGSCDACPDVLVGCTDSTAVNYNPEANEDDGSCNYCSEATVTFNVDAGASVSADYDNVVVNGSFAGPWYGWGVTLVDDDGDGIYSGTAVVEADVQHQYVHALTGPADGWSGWGQIGYAPEECALGIDPVSGDSAPNFYFTVGCGENLVLPTVCFASCVECVSAVPGCMDVAACNYNADATEDDLSCTYAAEGFDCEGNCLAGTFTTVDVEEAVVYSFGTYTYTLVGYGGSWSFTDASTGESVGSTATDNFSGCLVDGCYEVSGISGSGGYSFAYTLNGGEMVIPGNANEIGSDLISIGESGCITGCTDESAENYDATAHITDNTLCEYALVQGCMDATACNYDETAEQDNGSCTYAAENADCDGNCLEGTALSMDMTSQNWADGTYGATYTVSLNGVVVASGPEDTGNWAESSDDLGCLVDGCYEVDVQANGFAYSIDYYTWIFNGSSFGMDQSGLVSVGENGCLTACTDSTAENYNADADISDNTLCEYALVQGCTDATACNYDETAQEDNGSCTYAAEGFDCEGNCLAGTFTTVDVEEAIVYSFGTYTYTLVGYGGSWSFTDASTGESVGSTATDNFSGCLVDGCYEVSGISGSGGYSFAYTLNGGEMVIPGNANEIGSDLISIGESGCITGCTDESAENYDATAHITDNTLCEYALVQGCMDVTACNYDETAEQDNGSCTYAAENADCDGNCLEGTALSMDMTSQNWADGTYGATYTVSLNGVVVASGPEDTGNWAESSDDLGCLVDGCYEVDVQANGFAYSIDYYTWIFNGSSFGMDQSGLVSVGENGCLTACTDSTAENYNADADISDNTLCEYALVQGCTDATACNYDAAAEQDNGSCTYAAEGLDCDGNCISGDTYTLYMFDTYGDGWNGNELYVTDADGNVQTFTVLDSEGLVSSSFTQWMTDSDGDFIEEADPVTFCLPEGCASLSWGENEAVTWNSYVGETSFLITNADGDTVAQAEDGIVDGLFIGDCPTGCTNPLANNYDPVNIIDDGSCVFCIDGEEVSELPEATLPDDIITITIATGSSWSQEISWELYNDETEEFIISSTQTYVNNETYVKTTGCLPAACYKLVTYDSYGDGWNGNGTFTVTNQFGEILVPSTVMGPNSGINTESELNDGYGVPQELSTYFSIGDASCSTFGCTDPAASNYDADASVDDGSCITCPDGEVDVTFSFNQENITTDEVFVYNETDTVFSVTSGELGFWEGKTELMCVPAGCYTISMGASSSQGWTDGSQLQILDDLTSDYYFLDVDGGSIDLTVVSIGGGECVDTNVGGCTDEAYDNYNPDATYENGSCEFLCTSATEGAVASVEEDAETAPWSFLCSDASGNGAVVTFEELNADMIYIVADCDSAEVYSFNPNFEEVVLAAGECIYFQAVDAFNTDSVGTITASLFELPDTSLWGCMDEFACNYDELATYEPADACEYPEVGFDCDGVELADYMDVELDFTGSFNLCLDDDDYNATDVSDYPGFTWNTDGEDIAFAFAGDGNQVLASVYGYSDLTFNDGHLVIYNGNPLDGGTLVDSETYSGTEDMEFDIIFDTEDGNTYFVIVDSDNFDDCFEFDISITSLIGVGGCTDSAACNFDELADFNDLTCFYAAEGFDCENNFLASDCGFDNVITDSIAGPYSNNMLETYIYPSDGVTPVTIVFTSGETESCCDEWSIYDGTGDDAVSPDNLIAEFAGDLAFNYATGLGNGITVVFDSDGSVTRDDDMVFDVYCVPQDLVGGCIDSTACNYDAEANYDDGSCFFASEGFDCDNNFLASDCGFDNITTDSIAGPYENNMYEVFTYASDGETPVTVVFTAGETEANWDYWYVYDGIGDAAISIDNQIAVFDGDLAFNYATGLGNGITVVFDSDGSVTRNDDMVFDVYCVAQDVVGGCVDSTACNYSDTADYDDGTCFYPTELVDCNGDCFEGETYTISLFDAFGDGWASIGGQHELYVDGQAFTLETGTEGTFTTCLADICHEIYFVSGGVWANECTYSISDADGNVIYSSDYTTTIDNPASFGDECGTFGCTDPSATNYDETVDFENGSCEYPVSMWVELDYTTSSSTCLHANDYDATNTAYDPGFGTDFMNGDDMAFYFDGANGTVNASFVLTGPTTFTSMALFDGNPLDSTTTLLEFNQTGGSGSTGESMTFESNDSTTYYVVVDGLATWGCYDYDLSLSFTTGAFGCTDVAACNYDSLATADDGSCTYPDNDFVDCDGNCLFNVVTVTLEDADIDGTLASISVNEQVLLTGVGSVNACVDLAQCNTVTYNSNDDYFTSEAAWSVSDSTAVYASVAFGDYDNDLNEADVQLFGGACSLSGCMDSTACNYDPNAEVNYGCTYAEEGYDCDGVCLEDADLDGVCDADEISGCTDPTASNYDASATDDDESCIPCTDNSIELMSYDAFGDSWNGATFTMTDSVNTITSDGVTEYTDFASEFLCVPSGCYEVTVGGGATDYEISFTLGDLIVDAQAGTYTDISVGEMNGVAYCDIVEGCTDSTATNYNETSSVDDGSCCYVDADEDGICDDDETLGCTDANADNYDPNAGLDDGSCTFCNDFSVELIGTTDASVNGGSDGNVQATGLGGSSNYDVAVFDADGVPQNPFALSAGDYVVQVTDITSSCVAEQAFTIGEPAGANPCDVVPSGLSVDNIIHNRVTFNWSATDAAPSHYMIRYRVVGSGADDWTVISAGPVNTNSWNGTSRTRYFMEPGTTYEWSMRARVLNEDLTINCQSDWSANSEYTTLPACPNLDNLSVSAEASWVTFFADAPSEEWGVWQSKGKMRELGANNYRYVIGGNDGNINGLKGNFTASTDYEWHTKAWCTGNVDEDGNSDPMYHSGWGDFSAFSTEAPCDAMPMNLTTSSNGANTAVIMSWDTPESGAPDHYFLEMTNVTTGAVYEWNDIPGTATSQTKFNQNPGDEISWRIRGACGTNGTSWATIFSQPVTYTLGGERVAADLVSGLDVYPNPSRDIFNVTFTSEEAQTMSVKVVNMIGEEIYNEELIEFVGQYTKVIDMNTQPKGVYFLEITTSTGGINKKIVLQ